MHIVSHHAYNLHFPTLHVQHKHMHLPFYKQGVWTKQSHFGMTYVWYLLMALTNPTSIGVTLTP